jgi:predicted nucleic acid-binding protein
MRVVFADTGYWIALGNPRDALYRRAVEAPDRLGDHRIVTSEMVLVEVLNSYSGKGAHSRRAVAGLVQGIIDNKDIDLIPQTAQLFRDALTLYCARPDQSWSLTDCASFLIMERLQIAEALTHDRHFEQNGYRALLRD